VQTDRSYIRVGQRLETSAPNVFAAGDVIGKTMLVQNAAAQARVATENAILGYSTTEEDAHAPHGGFTDPEYGGVGLSEAAAGEMHATIAATVPFSDLDRAIIDGQTDGFLKLVVDRDSHHVLGAHAVGEQAVEIVEMVAAGMSAGVRVDQLSNLQLAYPTFVAIVGLASREIVRRLGVMPVSREWRALPEAPRGAEWERSEQQ
jgi:pyruvate/2-oxoglutarate dehydrogenase complex dihydrolipoamide dehydrogenase (E3) component